MNSRDYWRKRFEMLENQSNQSALKYQKELEKAYAIALRDIEKDIGRWQARLSSNNEITLSAAKLWLDKEMLKEFHWTVEEYIAYGEKNAIDQGWMKQLENASARVHIQKLEAIKLQIQQHIEALYNSRIDDLTELMKEIYSEQYYHTVFEVQKGFKLGFTLHALDERRLNTVIKKPWTLDNRTFSDRIWRDKQLLVNTLHQELTISIARGEAAKKTISRFAKKMETSKYNAARLVQTEQAFFSSAAQKQAFNDLDIEQYEIIATLDNRTSAICQSLDGKTYDMKDYQVGITAPPFHVRCRTATAPFFVDDDVTDRIARGLDGKSYSIPSNIKYPEWKARFVK